MQRKTGNPKPWVRKAEQDYAAALTLSRKRKKPLPDVVCFHAQQCAEKYLKAFLVSRRIYFPKTHDLLALLKLSTSHEPTLALLGPFLSDLRPYAVDIRYPGDQSTRAEARRATAHMRLVRERLRQTLGLKT